MSNCRSGWKECPHPCGPRLRVAVDRREISEGVGPVPVW